MFQKVVALSPDNLQGYNNLGGVYVKMGRYDDGDGGFLEQYCQDRRPLRRISNLGTC